MPVMRSRRSPARTFASAVLAVAMVLLGVRLFLPGEASACAPAGAGCCCETEGASPAAPETGGCGCSISPAVPVPVAVVTVPDGVTPPVHTGDLAEAPASFAGPGVATETLPAARARAAPTQALLETFRN